MTEKKETKKKKPSIKYQEGYPNERGFYKCKVGDEEMILIHHICTVNGRHWWSDTTGHDVVGHEIKFCNKKLTAQDI